MWSCCRTLAAEPLGWTIVLCSFLADALSLGARALFVVVLIFWQKEFNWTTSELSGIMSLAHVMQGLVIFLHERFLVSFISPFSFFSLSLPIKVSSHPSLVTLPIFFHLISSLALVCHFSPSPCVWSLSFNIFGVPGCCTVACAASRSVF